MQNYYPELTWKIDKVLLILLAFLASTVIIYAFIEDFLLKMRRRRLSNIKNNIYELLLQKKGKTTCIPGAEELTTKQFVDVVSNRTGGAVFFNEKEQEHLRRCFINQDNMVRIERIARNSRNKWRRIEAMLALGFAGASSAMTLLEKGLFDKDPDISYFSLLALGRIKTDLSLKILLVFLKKNALSRQKAASILEGFPPSAADLIIKLADNPDLEIRYWAIKILSRFKPIKHIEKIKILSSDLDPNVRAAACECLGKIGGTQAEEILILKLEDESWFVKVQAARALSEAMKAACAQYIVRLLNDNSLSVIETAGDILMKYTEAALPYLEKPLTGDDDLARRKTTEIMATGGFIEKLVRELPKDDSSEKRRMKLIAALKGSGAHYSIESAVLGLGVRERAEAIEKIKGIDEDCGRHLLQKSRGLIKEA
ncbi:MAG: HEAT repeat domain-containing protein [Candidatus Omnitrophica bacterium]|nr:HEAT repeat domain-containing protein [Candidatus Omnitrophota bacterium]